MAVQGLAPSFWAPLSDSRGRRLTFIGTFVMYLSANIGLALSKSFVALMVFRALQAAGSAATISVGESSRRFSGQNQTGALTHLLSQELVLLAI